MTERRQKANRASFGSTRKLPSGRWQARYTDKATGESVSAPRTFETKRAALDFLAAVRTDRNRGTFIDHRDGTVKFGDYARGFIDTGGKRGRLAPRTEALYRDLLRRRFDLLIDVPVNAIDGALVRRWYAATRKALEASATSRGGSGDTSLGTAYRFLSAVMNTAVREKMIAANPCQIDRAGTVKSPERPYIEIGDFREIVAAMPVKYQVAMWVKYGGHPRVSELVGLQRGDFDREAGTLRIERQGAVRGDRVLYSPTKTGEARTIVLPQMVAAMLADYLDASRGFGRDPMFTHAHRGRMVPVSVSALQKAWAEARRAAGGTVERYRDAAGRSRSRVVPGPHAQKGYHLHDVRGAGLTLAAESNASLKALMARAGHKTARAALIYQHVAERHQEQVSDRMNDAMRGVSAATTGTTVARGAVTSLESVALDGIGNPA